MRFIRKHILLLLPVCFWLSGMAPAQAQKSKKVYIEAAVPSDLDSTSREEMEWQLELTFAQQLNKHFQCVETLTRSRCRDMLKAEILSSYMRDEVFFDEGVFKEFQQTDHLLKISATRFGKANWLVSSFMWQSTPLRIIADVRLMDDKMDMYQIAEKVAEKLVKQLLESEFCPFTGTLNLDHHTTRNTNQSHKTPVSIYDQQQKQMCIGMQVSSHSVDMQQETHWEIRRLDRGPAYAKLRSDITEIIEEQEETDCYTCSSGRIGGRTHQITSIKRFFTDQVSEESSGPIAQHNDARIEIRFLEDSTYLVIVKATSVFDKNTTITTREVATGTCDPVNETETIETANTVFINITLGPFQGTPADHVLTASGILDMPADPEEEKSEVEYSFHFSR